MLKKKVVYTALTGSYDNLVQHTYVDPSYDYICFSNDFKEKKIGIWTIKRIPFETRDVQLLSRYPKLQPYKVLPEYELSLYVDANVDIKTPYVFQRIEEFDREGVVLAGVKHQTNNCLYAESLKVLLNGKEKNSSLVKKQMSLYKAEGFPLNYGMYEANVIFRRHNNEQVVKQCDDWWFYRVNYSKRDQLSYSFTLWKNSIPFTYLLPENQSTRNSSEIACYVHPSKDSYVVHRIKNVYFKFVMPLLFKLYFPLYYRRLRGSANG